MLPQTFGVGTEIGITEIAAHHLLLLLGEIVGADILETADIAEELTGVNAIHR